MGAMALFRRRAPRRIIGRYKAPPTLPAPSVEHLVDESRMVAHSAARMAVKNRLIMDAAGRRLDFDASALRGFARETLEQLAQQQRAAAEYEADREGGSGRRGAVLRGLADALEADAHDRDVLDSLVDDAREAAWDELSASLRSRMRAGVGGHRRDPDYEIDRVDRVAAFLALDLADLAYDRGVDLDEAPGASPVG